MFEQDRRLNVASFNWMNKTTTGPRPLSSRINTMERVLRWSGGSRSILPNLGSGADSTKLYFAVWISHGDNITVMKRQVRMKRQRFQRKKQKD